MIKKCMTVLLASAFALSMSLCSFAGSWQQDASGWLWQRDDGSYSAGGWEWIDDNGNGMAECYYFDPDGYCLIDTVTPDGYTVDANGAWIIDGIIQMQPVTATVDAVAQTLLPLPNGVPMKLMLTSGAGGWGEYMTLSPDGSFTGDSFDRSSDVYYWGKFTNIRQIDDYSFAMTVESWINEYGRITSPGSEFIFYLPGAIVNDPTEETYLLALGVAGQETAHAIEEGRPISTYALRSGDMIYFQYDY